MLSLHPRQKLEMGKGRVYFELTQVFLKEEISILRNVLILPLFYFLTESRMKRSHLYSSYEGRSKLIKTEQKLLGLILSGFVFTYLINSIYLIIQITKREQMHTFPKMSKALPV